VTSIYEVYNNFECVPSWIYFNCSKGVLVLQIYYWMAVIMRIPDYVALYTAKWMQKHITGKEVSFIQMLLHEIRL
jgi:hypothetical protein